MINHMPDVLKTPYDNVYGFFVYVPWHIMLLILTAMGDNKCHEGACHMGPVCGKM